MLFALRNQDIFPSRRRKKTLEEASREAIPTLLPSESEFAASPGAGSVRVAESFRFRFPFINIKSILK
jgi:hypothetical protein